MLKICLIATGLDNMGGQAAQARELVEHFKSENVPIGFVPIDPKLPGLFGQLQKIKYIRTLITSLAYFLLLFRRVPKFDVLHVFSASFSSFVLAPIPAILVGRFFKKRVLLNYHSGEAEEHLQQSKRLINRVISQVDALAVPSRYLQTVFQKYGIKSTVVHNVVDGDNFPYYERGTFKPKFLVTRTLAPLYNIPCILRAFQIIQTAHPEANLTILGSGSQLSQLKKMTADLGLSNVRFAGNVDRAEIAPYYQDHDFMLNASNIDNMPMSILEAFSAGLPVISTAAGGIPDIIEDGETGMLVPLDDHRALAEKAVFLLGNQETARRIAEAAHNDVTTLYSWPANREKWLALYNGSP